MYSNISSARYYFVKMMLQKLILLLVPAGLSGQLDVANASLLAAVQQWASVNNLLMQFSLDIATLQKQFASRVTIFILMLFYLVAPYCKQRNFNTLSIGCYTDCDNQKDANASDVI